MAMLARRLIDWIRETFGTVLVSHLKGISFSKTFEARDTQGRWQSIPYSSEPIFGAAVVIGQAMCHSGPRGKFQKIAHHSAIFDTVNNALNASASLDGAVMSGPALLSIPADIYSPVKKP